MADKNLSHESQDELFEKFKKIEAERIGIGTHEKFHELLKGLKELYLEKGGASHDK